MENSVRPWNCEIMACPKAKICESCSTSFNVFLLYIIKHVTRRNDEAIDSFDA